MMSLPDRTKLTEALQRGRLTPQELSQLDQHLAEHPDERKTWQEDLSLTDLLGQISDVPLSSNFTSQVLEAVRRENPVRSIGRVGWRTLLGRNWVPKLATSLSIVVFGLLAYRHHQVVTVRQEMARSLAEISEHSGGATLELLQNFDAIRRLGQVPLDTDKGLIAALQ